MNSIKPDQQLRFDIVQMLVIYPPQRANQTIEKTIEAAKAVFDFVMGDTVCNAPPALNVDNYKGVLEVSNSLKLFDQKIKCRIRIKQTCLESKDGKAQHAFVGVAYKSWDDENPDTVLCQTNKHSSWAEAEADVVNRAIVAIKVSLAQQGYRTNNDYIEFILVI